MHDIALDEAYAKWSDELVGYATAIAGPDRADDVVADAFATLLRREREDVAARRPSRWFAIVEPRPYLFRTVFNTAAMQYRTATRRRFRERRVAHADAVERFASPADGLLANPVVQAAVDALSAQQRSAVYLTYWLDFAVTDVADVLGCSVGAVKRHLARARATLRSALDRKVVR